jgi:alkanesulfonate monooxygenase SsuD/methylene tetrahydromethanopterin reductase-like flavin-dependent oxidoreductase (luciferase family)
MRHLPSLSAIRHLPSAIHHQPSTIRYPRSAICYTLYAIRHLPSGYFNVLALRRTIVKFGIFVFGDNHPELGRSNEAYYKEVLTMADWAEELGFVSFWLGEHHFYWYGSLPSPPMLIAALGQRTKKIRLGPAISVLPFHHPLLLAEEYAFADNLCGGRLNFAIGSGFSPIEYTNFGISIEEAKDRYWEAFDVILKAWRQQKFSHEGKFYRFENSELNLKPLQKPMPPTWVAASSDDTLKRSGELGFPIMVIPFARSGNILEVKQKNDLFLESYFKAGHTEKPDLIAALHVYVAETEKEATEPVRRYYDRILDYLRTSRRPGARVPEFDTVTREKLAIFSTPEQAIEILKQYEETGVTHVISMVNFGGVPMPEVRRTLELISSRVMPALARST